MSETYLGAFGLKEAPFTKEIADADLWLPDLQGRRRRRALRGRLRARLRAPHRRSRRRQDLRPARRCATASPRPATG